MGLFNNKNSLRKAELIESLASVDLSQDDINLLNRLTHLQQVKNDVIALQALTRQNVLQLNQNTFNECLGGNITTCVNKSISVDSNGFITFTDHNPI